MIELKRGPWKLTDLASVPKNGLKVFSCFHCGGGSTMGYKLAGFEMLGGVEIDPEMMMIYRKNHAPKHSYLMGVQDFNKIPRKDLPADLLKLDILDGSPPCSSFSMAGSREKAWGEKKKFREGQASQVLDDLFFHFIETARILQPKVVVAENVKGLVIGKAKGYVKQIFNLFNLAGYETQLFLLNSASMGVPQKRERTFFIARRKDLKMPRIKLSFNERAVSVRDAWEGLPEQHGNELASETKRLWQLLKPGQSMSKAENRGKGFNNIKIQWDEPSSTIASSGSLYHPLTPRMVSGQEVQRIQTFPDDFDFGSVGARYVCGMSVPPFMMQRVANSIREQLFNGSSTQEG